MDTKAPTVSSVAAQKPVAWFGMFLTIGAPMLIAMEPALPALVAAKLPPASVAIIVAAFGGLVTAVSAEAQKRGIAIAVPPSTPGARS